MLSSYNLYMKTETLLQTIKNKIKSIIVRNLYLVNKINISIPNFEPVVEKMKNPEFGDYSLKFLLKYKLSQQDYDKFSSYLIKKMKKYKIIKDVKLVNGYINFRVNENCLRNTVKQVIKQGIKYGTFKHKKIFYNLEFVSANPTGLLHIGHARGGAYGDSMARIWKKYGITLNREYYINDAGNQIENLKQAVFIRYLQLFEVGIELPEDSYHGEEIIEVARHLKQKYGQKFLNEEHVLDEEGTKIFKTESVDYLLQIIKKTLHDFGISFDIWFHEVDIYKYDLIKPVLNELKNYTYNDGNALFLKTTEFGDDKDRVLIKSDGGYTYFTPDIAYHKMKLMRGYDKIFNIWGADHKSYVDRMTIALQMLGYQKSVMTVFIQQMVRLVKNGQEFKMSKRTGNSLTIEDLLKTIGKTASRWFLVSTSIDSHLEIDIEKAMRQDSSNSVYYVEYAYARICSVLDKNKIKFTNKINLLSSTIEHDLLVNIHYYKDMIEVVAKNYNVHRMCDFLYNFSKQIHNYYTQTKLYDPNNLDISRQRCSLIKACSHVLESGLDLLGIEPRKKM